MREHSAVPIQHVLIYVNFDDLQAGVKTILKWTHNYAREHSAVPIQPVLA